MSASTTNYSSMLNSMWAPDGSEINERLKRLQELEQMRKERDAKRQALRNNTGIGGSSVRTSRLKSEADSDSSSRFNYRRTISANEDESGNFGGARPKLTGFSSYGQEQTSDNENIFSGTISDVLSSYGIRKPMRSNRDYTRSNNSNRTYGDSYLSTDEDLKRNMFSDFKSSYSSKPSYESRSKTQRLDSDQSDDFETVENGCEKNYGEEHTDVALENGEQVEEESEEDHGEEPKYFIERLKYGNGATQSDSSKYSGNHTHSIPNVPPFKQRNLVDESEENQNIEMPELVQPTDDILSVAQEISTTFGNFKSPTGLTPSKKYSCKENAKAKRNEGPKESVTYDIVEVDYDSSGDERGKLLTVNADISEWDEFNQTQGQLDEIHEFFTGQPLGEDPNISRELDGGKVKAELEKSFSKASTPKTDKNNVKKTPASLKRSSKKDTKIIRSKSPFDKLKSSDGENDSAHTSESEIDAKGLKTTTPRKAALSNSAKKVDKNGMSLSDKLAKLESLTQEKKRKHSFSENESKKSVPSYMSSTNASQKKRARAKDSSPKPSPRDLKKDVRELKQFVQQHTSEPNTPVTSPTKLFGDIAITGNERKNTRAISVQTEFVIDFPDINYVCKHCGKSSFEEVSSTLTKENLLKSLEKKTKRESPESDKAKTAENKFSSKDSVKSLGELSTKSEKPYRYKPKATTASHSYMKGTTSSRLKNSANSLSSTDGKVRKGSAPDIVHLAEVESTQNTPTLKGIVSQKTKAIESAGKREKSKPTLSVFKGNSVDRDTPRIEQKGQLTKSKSFDQVSVLKNEVQGPKEAKPHNEEPRITKTESTKTGSAKTVSTKTGSTKTDSTPTSHVPPPSPCEKSSHTKLKQKLQNPARGQSPVEKLDLTSLDSPRSLSSPRSPASLRKPPIASPRARDSPGSPRSDTSEIFYDADSTVESKGQFTTLDDNPFIKNDVKRRNSFKGLEKGESVWEKAESRSRDSSLRRSNSTSEADRERPGSASSLKRRNTNAGEKSSTSELTWSDSGSSESLKGSKSNLHGSNKSLNREGRSAFSRPRSVSTSSSTSQTSQNAMLNLLSPVGTTRNPVSGAMETDIDAAYNDHVKENTIPKADEHNEESVNRAHLEFAKKACDRLEFELKKRDSSNESDKDKKVVDDDKENSYQKQNGNNSHGLVNGADHGKKDKGMKGFLRGKLFKK